MSNEILIARLKHLKEILCHVDNEETVENPNIKTSESNKKKSRTKSNIKVNTKSVDSEYSKELMDSRIELGVKFNQFLQEKRESNRSIQTKKRSNYTSNRKSSNFSSRSYLSPNINQKHRFSSTNELDRISINSDDDFNLNKYKIKLHSNLSNISDSSSDDIFQSNKKKQPKNTNLKDKIDSNSDDDFILNKYKTKLHSNLSNISDSSSDDIFQSNKKESPKISIIKNCNFGPKIQSSSKKEESILYEMQKSQLKKEQEQNKNFSEEEEEELAQDKNCFINAEEEKYHKIISKIGEGAKTVAYKIQDIRTNQIICKKILRYNENLEIEDAQNLLKEFQVLYEIKHPCICRAFSLNIAEVIKLDDESESTTIALFLEYIDYNLKDILKNKNLDNTTKTKIVIEIAHGMSYLHKLGMIHRNLKIENIMLNSKLEAKIVDFELVSISEYPIEQDSLTRKVGTLEYMSPEMMNEEDYDCKTDVYSFGILLYYIFMQKFPKKIDGIKIQLPIKSTSISEFCIDLIKKCLTFKAEDRPTFDDILNEIRKQSYQLAPNVDKKILENRDNELKKYI